MRRFVVLIVISLIVGLALGSAQGKTIHVKVGGTGDGSSWGSAYGSLQDALDTAEPNDSIWVAEGMYKPTKEVGGTGDRYKTFEMINHVGIYGGFSSVGDPNWESRDWEMYETVLSGDLLGNDDPCTPVTESFYDPCRVDNSYHIFRNFYLDSTAHLDGFTITGGYAGIYNGGGMANYHSNPTVSNCIFTDNAARGVVDYAGGGGGGGMYNYGGRPRIEHCTFLGNAALGSQTHQGHGGAICNISSDVTLLHCTFSKNVASWMGCAIFNEENRPIIEECTFTHNSIHAGVGPGATIFNNESSPKVNGCTFENNTSQVGGAMFNNYGNPTVTNCTFENNTSQAGGAMYNNYGNPTITNCTFNRNSAEGGGGILNINNNPTIKDCIFTANEGGGMHNAVSDPVVSNCTFIGNSAVEGGGLGNWDSSPILTNCILWNNITPDGPQIYEDGTSSTTVTYSDVQDGWEGTGNIDTDPCFVDPGYWGNREDPNIIVEPDDPNAVWINGDFHLLEDSACIDSGDPNYIAGPNETDLDGNPRIIGGRIDIGAYEYNPPIPAEVRIIPHTINLTSKGKWIAALLKLSEDCNVADIDPDNVFIENNIKSLRFWLTEDQQVAIAMFDRLEVQAILNTDNIKLTITGWLIDGTSFEGKDTIKIIDNDNSDRNKGRK